MINIGEFNIIYTVKGNSYNYLANHFTNYIPPWKTTMQSISRGSILSFRDD